MGKQPHILLDPANFWLYTPIMVLLSVTSAALLEVLKAVVGGGSILSMSVTALVCFVLTVGCWFLCWYLVQRRVKKATIGIFQIYPTKAKSAVGLIALCSTSAPHNRNTNPAFEVAKYHRGTLQHLWLITSHSAKETADWINQQVKGWGVNTHSPVVLDDTWSVDLIRLKVEEVRRQAVEGCKIPEAEVICDFTGMPKPVTAGMILACAPKGRRLEYLQGQYDEAGKLAADQPIPIEIEIQYQIEPEI